LTIADTAAIAMIAAPAAILVAATTAASGAPCFGCDAVSGSGVSTTPRCFADVASGSSSRPGDVSRVRGSVAFRFGGRTDPVDIVTAVLAAVGVACAVVALAAYGRHRRAPAVTPEGVFRCRVRASAAGDGEQTWPWRRARARWVHDVLLLEWGILVRRRHALGVRTAYGVLETTRTLTSDEGDVTLRFELDEGTVIQVTACETAADALGGPFLCAHPALRRTRPPI
jgi:hypothetical protein